MKTRASDISSLVQMTVAIGDFAQQLQSSQLSWKYLTWTNLRPVGIFAAAVFQFAAKHQLFERLPKFFKSRPKRATPKRAAALAYQGPGLASMLAAGFFGGFVGGVMGGVPFGIYYYFHAYNQPPLRPVLSQVLSVVFENVLFALAIGIVAGAFTQLSIYFVRKYWGANKLGLKEFIASTLAAAIGGALLGYIGGDKFGMRNLEPPGMAWVVGCATFGTCCIAFGALLYEYKLDWGRVLKALAVVMGLFVLAAIVGERILDKVNVDLGKGTAAEMAVSGAKIGLITGAIMGAQIAGTALLYRVLSEKRTKASKARRKR